MSAQDQAPIPFYPFPTSVTSVANGGISATSLQNNTLTADKIADDALPARVFATGALTADAFAAGALAAATFAASALAGQIIRSIQDIQVTILTSASTGQVTISAVNLAKSIIVMMGWRGNSGAAPLATEFPVIYFTNSTTVTAERGFGTVPATFCTLRAFVVEFM